MYQSCVRLECLKNNDVGLMDRDEKTYKNYTKNDGF